MLSRSDFGLMPFVLTASALLFQAPFRRLAAAALLGSIVGLSGVVAHTFVVSGHVYQGSTRAKRKWSQLNGDLKRYSVNFAAQPFYRHPWTGSIERRKDMAPVFGFCGLGLVAGLTRRKSGNKALVVAMALTPIGYILVYRFDSAALQPWYLANFLLPYSVILAALLAVDLRIWRTAALAVSTCWSVYEYSLSFSPVWPAQQGFYEAALYLRQHHQTGPVGVWNAGIVRFFSDAQVVNQDGLVNDDVDDAVLQNRLPDYLRAHRINTLVDNQMLLTDPAYRARGATHKKALRIA